MTVSLAELVRTPRLFLSGQEWDNLAHKLQDPYFAELARNSQAALDCLDRQHGSSITEVPRVLGRDVPSAHDPANYVVTYRVLRNRLIRTAVAFHLHRDERWLNMARQTVDELLNPKWLEPGHAAAGIRHADLKTGDLMYAASFALDVWGRHLDADRVQKLWTMLRDHLLPAYMTGVKEMDWWRHADFNWGSALHGNAGLAALLIEPADPDYAAQVLSTVRDGLQYVIEALPAHGGWTEGFMYQTTMLGHLTDFVAALDRVKGDDLGLAANRNLLDVLEARPYFIMGDGHVLNFSNCHERTSEYCLPHAFWWAQKLGRPQLAGFEQDHTKGWRDTHGIFYEVEAFWYRQTFQESRRPQLTRLKHCSQLDWFIWHGQSTWLGFRSGYNGGNHNNLDLGQIIFGAGADRFLADPGYGATLTSQHNAVTIRGKEQTDGASARIFRIRELPGGFYLACDLTSAFPHTTSHYIRHVLLVDETHLLIVDDILGKHGKRNSARYHLQTHLPYQRTETGVVLQGEHARAWVKPLSGFARFAEKKWEWADLPVHTLTWMDSYDKVHSVHPALLSLKDEPVQCSMDMDHLMFTAGRSRYVIDLAEGSVRSE